MLIGEVGLFMIAAAGLLWLTPRHGPLQWYHACMWALVITLPICANLIHGDRPADSGLRLDNLVSSGKEVLMATLVLGVIVAVIGLIKAGWPVIPWRKVAADAGTILAFAFVQQYAMQAFVLRRLRQTGMTAAPAVFITVMCFGFMHMPNPVLTGLTAVVGVFWCTLFIRRPNLLTLSVSHCLLTLLVRSLWPKAWHLGLAVGPKVLERAQQAGWW